MFLQFAMSNKKYIWLAAIFLVFFYSLVFIFPKAPWEMVDPPYFEYSMGEIFKEVSLEEGKSQMNFQVYPPNYIPAEFPEYKTAIRVRPENEAPEIYFFTPHFPGTEEGITPANGIKIVEYPLSKRDSYDLEGQNIMISGTSAWLDGPGSDNKYGLSFQIDNTAVDISWFGDKANKEELVKIAEAMILNK